MNKRIRRKILKRCITKFKHDTRKRHSNMPYEEFLSILTGLERKVWVVKMVGQWEITDKIFAALKAEGKW